MEFWPTGSEPVWKVATPLTSGFVANVVVPWVKITVPEGVPPVPVTAAVKVTCWLSVDGFGEELRAVEEVTLFTVWVVTLELVAKLESPL